MPAERVARVARVARMVRVVRVVPNVAAVSKSFDYLVPESLAARVRVGAQVRVTLHGRRVDGWVVEDDAKPQDGVALRPLDAVRGWGPPPSVVSLALWAAWRWAGPVPAFLKAASSERVVSSLPATFPGPPAGASGGRWVGRPAPESARRSRQGDGPSEGGDDLLAKAFSGGTTVLRLPPAADLLSVVHVASALLGTARADGDPERETACDARYRAGVLVLSPSHEAARGIALGLRASGRQVALLPEDWGRARAGGCVVIGTRSAAFAPLPRLLAAVVLDAHDEAFHEERAPTWCAWEVVVERARRDSAPCCLVSPCPTLDLLAAGPLLVASRRSERAGWAPVEVVDRRGDDPRTGLFSERVVSTLRWAAADPGRKALCVLNTTGRVRLMACASCGELARCRSCDGPLETAQPSDDGAWLDAGEIDTVRSQPLHMRCRRCGSRRPLVCARCGGTRMKALRLGVSRVREELEALLRVPVSEIWGKRGAVAEAETAALDARVVVGTEAVLHRVPKADLVVFLDFDSELLAPRMRAPEEAFSLLARASRVVSVSASTATDGRASGRIVVQTRAPDHDVLRAAVSADPGRLSAAEYTVRQSLELPPFRALALITGPASESFASSLSTRLHETTKKTGHEPELRGPSDGTWLLEARTHEDLSNLLAEVPRPRGRLRVEVDPVRA